MQDGQVEKESLQEEMRNVVEEARMVIPGIQALIGFQTMAVFNNRFEDLPGIAVAAYLLGLALLALSMALLLTPAAYHRLAERGQVSRRMIDLSSRLITAGMAPLMLGLSLDVFVVFLASLDELRIAAFAGLAAACVFTGLWFVFPLARKKQT
jgi:hypothetical protein